VSPFTRDHHLSDLGLELLEGDELSPEDTQSARAHLIACEACRTRAAAFGLPADPLAVPRPANDPAGRRRWLLGGLAIAASIAAAVGLGSASTLPSEADGWRTKGTGLTLQVVLDTGDGAEPLPVDSIFHPGDRLGFVVASSASGHLMVLTTDPNGQVDVCHPTGGHTSAPVDAGPASPLVSAVRADGVLGEARFVALRCDSPFSVADARRVVNNGKVPEGCMRDDVVLTKVTE